MSPADSGAFVKVAPGESFVGPTARHHGRKPTCADTTCHHSERSGWRLKSPISHRLIGIAVARRPRSNPPPNGECYLTHWHAPRKYSDEFETGHSADCRHEGGVMSLRQRVHHNRRP